MLSHIKKYRDELRIKMKDLRANVDPKLEEDASTNIATTLLAHPFLQEARLIGSYVSVRHEISTYTLNAQLKAQGHSLALPVIDPKIKGYMDFFTFEDDSELIENHFGILEPPPFHERLINPEIFEVILLPLLAFDLKGNRMGMGGGYYDRLLKKLSASCVLIGLAYDFQLEPNLQVQRWDMPIDEVITPTKHYVFSKKY